MRHVMRLTGNKLPCYKALWPKPMQIQSSIYASRGSFHIINWSQITGNEKPSQDSTCETLWKSYDCENPGRSAYLLWVSVNSRTPPWTLLLPQNFYGPASRTLLTNFNFRSSSPLKNSCETLGYECLRVRERKKCFECYRQRDKVIKQKESI